MSSPENQNNGRRGIRLLIKGTVMFLLLAAVAWAAKHFNFDELFAVFKPGGDVSGSPWYAGGLGFVIFAGCLVAIAVPRQIVSFFAAFLFGLWPGLALAICATALGCILDYLVGRITRRHVSDLIFGKVQVAVKFWADNPFSVSFIIRLLPAGSNFMTSLAAGAAGISAIPFFAGSILGYVPQTLVFGLMGSGINVNSGIQIALSVILFACSGLLGLWIFRKNRRILRNTAPSGS